MVLFVHPARPDRLKLNSVADFVVLQYSTKRTNMWPLNSRSIDIQMIVGIVSGHSSLFFSDILFDIVASVELSVPERMLYLVVASQKPSSK